MNKFDERLNNIEQAGASNEASERSLFSSQRETHTA